MFPEKKLLVFLISIRLAVRVKKFVAAKPFAKALKLQRANATLTATFQVGPLAPMQHCIKNLVVQIVENFTIVRPCRVSRIVHDTVLGKLRLSEANSKGELRSNTKKLCIRDSGTALDTGSIEGENSIQKHSVTGSRFSRLTRKSSFLGGPFG